MPEVFFLTAHTTYSGDQSYKATIYLLYRNEHLICLEIMYSLLFTMAVIVTMPVEQYFHNQKE